MDIRGLLTAAAAADDDDDDDDDDDAVFYINNTQLNSLAYHTLCHMSGWSQIVFGWHHLQVLANVPMGCTRIFEIGGSEGGRRRA